MILKVKMELNRSEEIWTTLWTYEYELVQLDRRIEDLIKFQEILSDVAIDIETGERQMTAAMSYIANRDLYQKAEKDAKDANMYRHCAQRASDCPDWAINCVATDSCFARNDKLLILFEKKMKCLRSPRDCLKMARDIACLYIDEPKAARQFADPGLNEIMRDRNRKRFKELICESKELFPEGLSIFEGHLKFFDPRCQKWSSMMDLTSSCRPFLTFVEDPFERFYSHTRKPTWWTKCQISSTSLEKTIGFVERDLGYWGPSMDIRCKPKRERGLIYNSPFYRFRRSRMMSGEDFAYLPNPRYKYDPPELPLWCGDHKYVCTESKIPRAKLLHLPKFKGRYKVVPIADVMGIDGRIDE